jgi:hypothetical protein
MTSEPTEPGNSRIRWVSETACQRLKAHLDERLSQTLAHWGLPAIQGSEVLPGRAVRESVEAASPSLQWQLCPKLPGVWVAWPAASEWPNVMLSQIFPGARGAAPLAGAVANQAASGLKGEISALAGGPLEPGQAPSPQSMRHGHWGLVYRATVIPGLSLLMVWNTDALAQQGWLEPAPALPSVPAWSPGQAFSPARMRFELQVGDTDIMLGDLGQLQVGDVLVLRQSIDEPLLLQSLDGMFQRSVYLGQYQGRRAAQFTPLSSK